MTQQPYAYPHAPQAPAPMGAGAGVAPSAVAGAATLALAFVGLRAAWPVITYVVPIGRLMNFDSYETARLFWRAIDGGLSLLALIFYWIWFAKMYSWVRENRGGTRFSNGMAIGGWFIPFANFAIPYMAMRDAWRRANNDQSSILVVLWWATYLLSIPFSNYDGSWLLDTGLSIDTMNLVHTLVYWVGNLIEITTWGVLALMIQTLTKRAAER